MANHLYHRRSIRLKGYDYSQAGIYCITICVKDRACLFGKTANEEMILNDAGKMVETEWLALPNRFPNIQSHDYVMMPNHFHGLLRIMPIGVPFVVALNPTTDSNDVAVSEMIVRQDEPMMIDKATTRVDPS